MKARTLASSVLTSLLSLVTPPHVAAGTVALPGERSYQYHQGGAAPDAAVVWLHPHTATAADMATITGANTYAGTRVLMVYGQAARHADGTLQWYDGRWPTVETDLVYLGDLLRDVRTRWPSVARIALAGHSNGAMMVLRAFCEPERVGVPVWSYVAVAGSMPVTQRCDHPDPTGRLTVVTGTADPVIPYCPYSPPAAGCPLTRPGEVGAVIGAEATIVTLAAQRGSDVTPMASWGRFYPPTRGTDGTSLTVYWHGDSPDLVGITVVGGGHTWPGHDDGGALGVASQELDATQLVMDLLG